MKGTIKRFFFRKGFGFIENGDGAEYFFHYTDYSGDKRDLRPGLAVEFEPTEGDKGPCAVQIAVPGGAPAAPRDNTQPPARKRQPDSASTAPAGSAGGMQFVFGLLTGSVLGALAVALAAGLF